MSYQSDLTGLQIDGSVNEVINTNLAKSGSDVIVGNYMFTADGGIAKQLTNRTGLASIKGTLAESHESGDNGFETLSDEYDCIGIVYENGIADGEECWVIVTGIAEVLIEDGTASTHGNWVEASTVDGRANATLSLPSGGTIQELQNHFKEIGHCLESKTAGTDVLAKIILHFN